MQRKLFNIFIAFVLAFSMVPMGGSSALAEEEVAAQEAALQLVAAPAQATAETASEDSATTTETTTFAPSEDTLQQEAASAIESSSEAPAAENAQGSADAEEANSAASNGEENNAAQADGANGSDLVGEDTGNPAGTEEADATAENEEGQSTESDEESTGKQATEAEAEENPEETSAGEGEEATEEDAEDEPNMPAFDQTEELDGIAITVKAPKGVFPEGAKLSIEEIIDEDPDGQEILDTVEDAISEVREEAVNVALARTFDIKVVDEDDNEIEPSLKDKEKIQVDFRTDLVDNSNLSTAIYHISENEEYISYLEELQEKEEDKSEALDEDEIPAPYLAEELKTKTDGDTATVKTDGFSYYTVEFTYGDLTYVIEGDTEVSLAEIMNYVGLVGRVTNVEVSNNELLFVYEDLDDWRIVALQSFETEEWMKVTIDGLEYEIVLTDYIPAGSQTAGGTNFTDYGGDFASGLKLANYTILDNMIREHSVRGDRIVDPLPSGFSSVNSTDTNKPQTSYIHYTGQFSGNAAVSLPKTTFNDGGRGCFQMVYKNAAMDSAGNNSYDVVIRYTDIVVHTEKDRSGTWNDTIRVYAAWEQNGGLPDFNIAVTSTSGRRYTAEVTAEVWISKRGGYADTQRQPISDGTFIISTHDVNVNRTGVAGFANVHGADDATNGRWSESIRYVNPYDGEIVLNSSKLDVLTYNGEDFYVAKLNAGGGKFASEIAAVANTTGITLKTWGSLPPRTSSTGAINGTDVYLFPDRMSHNTTSSSGRYGKIETTEDGNPNGDLSDGSKVFYGGRYYAGVNQKRTYDVADGKTVIYTMTPEDGYIINKLYIAKDSTTSPYNTNGTKNSAALLTADPTTDSNYEEITPNHPYFKYFKTYYKADGSVDYYTFEFPPNFNDETAGNYYNRHIHVTWQPATSIEVEKKWEDIDDFYGVRPAEIYIDLLQDGTSYDAIASGNTDKLYYNVTDQNRDGDYNNPTLLEETRTSDINTVVSSSSSVGWKGTWTHTYQNLPKYANYDDSTNTGDPIEYKVKESITDPVAQKYYQEVTPHKVERNTASTAEQYIVDNHSDTADYLGYSETALSYNKEDYDYEITNKLNYSDLYIEKEVIAGSDKGKFAFDVTLENGDVTSHPLTTSNSGQGPSVSYVVGNVAGDSLFSQNAEKEAALQVLEGTSYTVTEKYQDGWMQTARSPQAASGTILNTSDVYGFKVVSGASGADTVYVYKGGSLYQRDGKTTVDLSTLPDAKSSGLIKDGQGNNVDKRYFDYQGVEVYEDGNGGYEYADGTAVADRYYDANGKNVYPDPENPGSYIYADGSAAGSGNTSYSTTENGKLYDSTGRLVASDGAGGYNYVDEDGNVIGAVPKDQGTTDIYDAEGNKIKSDGNGGYEYDGGANDGQPVVTTVYDENWNPVTSFPVTPKIYDENGNELAGPPADKPYYDENGSEVTTGGRTGYVHVLDGTEVVAHIFDAYGEEIFDNGNGGYEYADGTQAPRIFDGSGTQVYPDGNGGYRYADGTEVLKNPSTTTTVYDRDGNKVTTAGTISVQKAKVTTVTYSGPVIQGNSIVYKGSSSDGKSVSNVVYAKGIHRAWFENVKTMDLTVYKQWLDDKTDSHTAAELVEAFRIYKRDNDTPDPDELAEDVTSLYANGGTSNTYPDITHYSSDSVNTQDYITVTQDSSDSTLWKYELKGIPAYYRDPGDDNIGTQDHALAYFIKEDKYSFDKNDDYLAVKYATDKNDLSSGANSYDPTSIRTGDYTEANNDPAVKYIINRKKVDLAIGKEVTGNQGSRDKYFKITLTLEGLDAPITGSAGNVPGTTLTLDESASVWVKKPSQTEATVYGAGAMGAADANSRDDNAVKNGIQLVADNSGKIEWTFYLKAGEKLSLKDLPAGAKYTVAEVKEDYMPTTSIAAGDTLFGGPDSTTKVALGKGKDTITDTALMANTELLFSNTRNGAIPTEIRVPGWESFMLLFIAMLGLALLAMRRNRTVKEVAHERRASQFPVRSSQKYAKARRKTQPKHARST